jgi:hypothetical protein
MKNQQAMASHPNQKYSGSPQVGKHGNPAISGGGKKSLTDDGYLLQGGAQGPSEDQIIHGKVTKVDHPHGVEHVTEHHRK